MISLFEEHIKRDKIKNHFKCTFNRQVDYVPYFGK